MTTQINQLTELTTTSDGDLLLIRESATGVDKKIQSQNLRAKATTKDDVGLGNVPNLDTTDAVAGNFSSVNIDGGNIDGTPIGVSSASSGAFTTLTATNNDNSATGPQFLNNDAGTSSRCVTKYSNGNNVHEFGIAGTNYAGYGVIGASTAHIYSTGNKNIALAADGNSNIVFGTGAGVPERMRIDSSGNVGIGVTSITNYSGRSNLTLGGTTNTGLLEFVNSGGSQAYIYGDANGILNIQARPTSSESTQVKINSAGDSGIIALQTDNQERMRIDSSGNVGIGVTSVSSVATQKVLEVAASSFGTVRTSAGNSSVRGEMVANSSTNRVFVGSATNHPLTLGTNDQERMRIDSSGNVGIGTDAPSTAGSGKVLALNGGSNGAQIKLQTDNTGSTSIDGVLLSVSVNSSNGFLWNYGNADLIFGTNNTERLRIDSSGNVGIGVTNPSQKLTVNGSVGRETATFSDFDSAFYGDQTRSIYEGASGFQPSNRPPAGNYFFVQSFRNAIGGNFWIVQIAYNIDGRVWTRRSNDNGSTWTSWVEK